MTLNVAVDIGGTFTDLIGYESNTGEIFSAKSDSTPKDLTVGITRCLEKSGLAVSDLNNFVHGSTVAINTVIERTGAPTALVVTRGTRDVYKIGRGNRPEAYNIFFKRPEPLVPRHLTFEIEERLLSTGEILTPLDIPGAREQAEKLAGHGVEAVAVCLLHSWANPVHESQVGKILNESAPGAYLSLSHEILREYGEYERISTTVLNAYIGPKVSQYIDDLEKMLEADGFRGSLLIMQSNGGVMSPAVAKKTPAAMLESGPVGGFIAAGRVGERLGYRNIIAFDMGGTTAKTSLIKDGELQLSHGYYIGGYGSGHPMMLPVIDAVEIGSGGGSIAWVDDMGSLKVGPRSAGAEPGPICYGRGGRSPTITDANLILGRLSPDHFLGGEMPLDVERAKEGVSKSISSRLNLSDRSAALAITKIAVMNMSLAVRGISVERGYDPRDFAIVAFGGAGALHAVEVARELHIPTVIVPNYPGQFSALGMLMADIQHDYVRTYYRALVRADFRELLAISEELVKTGRLTLEGENVPPGSMVFQRYLDIRYTGQEFSIPVPIPSEYIERGDGAAIRKAFDEHHERRYGYHTPEQQVEIVNVRVSAIGRRKEWRPPALEVGAGEDPLIDERLVYFGDGSRPVACPIYDRTKLAPEQEVAGPAIIQEYASTAVMFPGDKATVSKTGELLIRIGGTG